MTDRPSDAAMRAAANIAKLYAEQPKSGVTWNDIAALVDAEIVPLADAERAELVRQIESMVRDGTGYGWLSMLNRCADALSRPAPGWDDACEAIACKLDSKGRGHGEYSAAIARGMKGQGTG